MIQKKNNDEKFSNEKHQKHLIEMKKNLFLIDYIYQAEELVCFFVDKNVKISSINKKK